MPRAPKPSRALAKLPANLPANVRTLEYEQQRAWAVRASGGTWREAARAANVKVAQAWAWARLKPFREAQALAYTPLDDSHRAVLARCLEAAADPEASDKEQDRGLKAAVHVARGLGLGIGSQTVGVAHAPAIVHVNLDLRGSGPTLAPAAFDLPLDAPTVAETQPARAFTSSQATRVERGE